MGELEGSNKASWRKWHLKQGLKGRENSDDVYVKRTV